jgi:hypothetical protein
MVGATGTVAVPGAAGIAVGAVGLGAATLASTDAFRPYWLQVWLLAAVVGAGVGALAISHRASAGGRMRSAESVRRIFVCLLPSLFAGAVLTAVLWRGGYEHAIPGTWLLLYGCALIHAGAVTSKAIALLGAVFVALAFVAFGLSESHQVTILGIGFGELHILYGLVLRRIGNGAGA